MSGPKYRSNYPLEFLNPTAYFIPNYPINYKINISTAFGLTPDASKNHNQIHFFLVLARHYISVCKKRKPLPIYKTTKIP